jgi:predicted DNA-binding transcriptional regulator AlpA
MLQPYLTRFLSWEDLFALGVITSRTQARHLWEAGKFPRPVHLSKHTLAWPESVIQAWIASKAAIAEAAAIAALSSVDMTVWNKYGRALRTLLAKWPWDRLINLEDLRGIYGDLPRSRWQGLVENGEIPRPIMLSSRTVAWRASDVHQWLIEIDPTQIKIREELRARRERKRAAHRAWRAENKDQINAKQRARSKEEKAAHSLRTCTWQKANPDKTKVMRLGLSLVRFWQKLDSRPQDAARTRRFKLA